jgi:tetratricopeptide (TPR) repeat protein
MRTPSESDFVAELKRSWPREGDASEALLARADEATAAWPRSAALLRLQAALIQLASENSRYSLEGALACYKRALTIDPNDVETLEDVAHFYDAVLGNETEAQTYFALANQERQRLGMPPNTSLERTRDR